MSETAIADVVAGVIGELLPHLNKWRKTNSGIRNAWSFEGLRNVLRLEGHMTAVQVLLGAEISSCFRCREVNKAVGGVDDSYHQQGAACDYIKRTKFPDVDAAANAVLAAAKAGRVGPVREIIPEHKTGAVHVDWYTRGNTGAPRLVQDARY